MAPFGPHDYEAGALQCRHQLAGADPRDASGAYSIGLRGEGNRHVFHANATRVGGKRLPSRRKILQGKRNRLSGVGDSFIHCNAFGGAAGKSRECHRVATAIWIGLEHDGIRSHDLSHVDRLSCNTYRQQVSASATEYSGSLMNGSPGRPRFRPAPRKQCAPVHRTLSARKPATRRLCTSPRSLVPWGVPSRT